MTEDASLVANGLGIVGIAPKAMPHTVIFNSLLAGVAEGDDLAHYRRMRGILSFLDDLNCPLNMRYMSRVHWLNFEADNHWKRGE
jgi:hypothetical protein